MTTRYGDEENNAVIPIDEAIKEAGDNKDYDSKDSKNSEDNINSRRNIMDFLGDK
ncbi:hypothetical protein [Vulcanisaeta distributa]|uniref:hypothetical protein n=1 Tax=Vulcanisaeta distributa TaxID=164451 RepID=UPI001FB2A594|nr:hypothetical protein [Vulcanisaeta distributa]